MENRDLFKVAQVLRRPLANLMDEEGDDLPYICIQRSPKLKDRCHVYEGIVRISPLKFHRLYDVFLNDFRLSEYAFEIFPRAWQIPKPSVSTVAYGTLDHIANERNLLLEKNSDFETGLFTGNDFKMATLKFCFETTTNVTDSNKYVGVLQKKNFI